jgi:hypothetical protein
LALKADVPAELMFYDSPYNPIMHYHSGVLLYVSYPTFQQALLPYKLFSKFPFFGDLPVTDAIWTSFTSYRETVLNSQLLVSMYLKTHPHIITMEIYDCVLFRCNH